VDFYIFVPDLFQMTVRWSYSLMFLLLLVAAASLSAGLWNAVRGSIDSQLPSFYSVLHGMSPYHEYLGGNALFESSIPNYLPQFYLLGSWMGFIENVYVGRTVWAMIQVVATGIMFAMALRRNPSGRRYYFFVLAGILASLPYRNALGNGQNTILMMALIYIFIMNARLASVAHFAGFSKWTLFGPFSIIEVRSKWKYYFLLFPVLQMVSFLMIDWISGLPALTSMKDLFALYRHQAFISGQGEVDWSGIKSSDTAKYIALIIYATGLGFSAMSIWRHGVKWSSFVLLIIASLGIVYHRHYDFLILALPLLIFAPQQVITAWKQPQVFVFVLLLLYEFFAYKLIIMVGMDFIAKPFHPVLWCGVTAYFTYECIREMMAYPNSAFTRIDLITSNG
jgi:hypothetical protein